MAQWTKVPNARTNRFQKTLHITSNGEIHLKSAPAQQPAAPKEDDTVIDSRSRFRAVEIEPPENKGSMQPVEEPLFRDENKQKTQMSQRQSTALSPITQKINQVVRKYSSLDTYGERAIANVNSTTERLVKKFKMNSSGDLGNLVVALQTQADRLDPQKLEEAEAHRGLVGWLKSKFVDVKQQLAKQYETADHAFDEIGTKIDDHINTQKQWLVDLTAMKEENFNCLSQLQELIINLHSMEEEVEAKRREVIPQEGDDDYYLNLQLAEEYDSISNRIKVKIDHFTRMASICEASAVQLRTKEDTSRNAIQALQNSKTGIPIIKSAFIQYMHAKQADESVNVTNNLNNLTNRTIKANADLSLQSGVKAAEAFHNPAITDETLSYVHDKMLETFESVHRIQQDFNATHEESVRRIEEGRAQFREAINGEYVKSIEDHS